MAGGFLPTLDAKLRVTAPGKPLPFPGATIQLARTRSPVRGKGGWRLSAPSDLAASVLLDDPNGCFLPRTWSGLGCRASALVRHGLFLPVLHGGDAEALPALERARGQRGALEVGEDAFAEDEAACLLGGRCIEALVAEVWTRLVALIGGDVARDACLEFELPHDESITAHRRQRGGSRTEIDHARDARGEPSVRASNCERSRHGLARGRP